MQKNGQFDEATEGKRTIVSLIEGSGLPFAAELATFIQPSIRLRTKREKDHLLKKGASKVGGSPDLVSPSVWPSCNGFPLRFLAQIWLPDLAAYDPAGLLPRTGIVWFFSAPDAYSLPWGQPQVQDETAPFRVLYSDGGEDLLSSLSRTPPPTNTTASYAPCALEFGGEWTLPPLESRRLAAFGFDKKYAPNTPAELEKQVHRYLDLLEAVSTFYSRPSDTALHRMLGYCDPLQEDTQSMLSVLSPTRSREFVLLLQVDTDPVPGFSWVGNGDISTLYFWIERDHLKRASFEETRAKIQVT